jgi:hypothetical protein
MQDMAGKQSSKMETALKVYRRFMRLKKHRNRPHADNVFIAAMTCDVSVSALYRAIKRRKC